MACEMRIGADHSEIPDLGRMLSDCDIDISRLDIRHHRGWCVKGNDFDFAAGTCLFRSACRTHRGKQVCSEDPGEIRVARHDGLKLGSRFVCVVVIKLSLQYGDVRMLLHFILEAFLTLVGRGYSRVRS